MNSTFRTRWLASLGVISEVLFTPEQAKKNNWKWLLSVYCHKKFKVSLWAASYSACVVYTKTIIHLSVGESGVDLPPLQWIIVNYHFCFLSPGSCFKSAICIQNSLEIAPCVGGGWRKAKFVTRKVWGRCSPWSSILRPPKHWIVLFLSILNPNAVISMCCSKN